MTEVFKYDIGMHASHITCEKMFFKAWTHNGLLVTASEIQIKKKLSL